MQYKVLKIEEDMDFGCEERQPGEALMSIVLIEDENGNETICDMMTASCMKEISMREILLPWTGSISRKCDKVSPLCTVVHVVRTESQDVPPGEPGVPHSGEACRKRVPKV